MPNLPLLTGPERKPRSGKAKQLVVILHGWGADGDNLIDLADLFAQALPDAHFFAPNAPDICEVNPYGYQWFSLMDRRMEPMLSGARQAADTLNAFLDARQQELGLDNSHTALVGFSQGTMLSLHAGLRHEPPLACIVGYSGMLLGPELLAREMKSKPPVCLIHGQLDDVVPYTSLNAAESVLRAHGLTVETHTRPGIGHSIDMPGIEIAAKFLKAHLAG